MENKINWVRCGICYKEMYKTNELNEFSYCGCENDKTGEQFYEER